jgi:hypothetical protein
VRLRTRLALGASSCAVAFFFFVPLFILNIAYTCTFHGSGFNYGSPSAYLFNYGMVYVSGHYGGLIFRTGIPPFCW